jgi:hypothetical protein
MWGDGLLDNDAAADWCGAPLCQPGVRHDELLKRWPEGERGDRPPDEFEQPGA